MVAMTIVYIDMINNIIVHSTAEREKEREYQYIIKHYNKRVLP